MDVPSVPGVFNGLVWEDTQSSETQIGSVAQKTLGMKGLFSCWLYTGVCMQIKRWIFVCSLNITVHLLCFSSVQLRIHLWLASVFAATISQSVVEHISQMTECFLLFVLALVLLNQSSVSIFRYIDSLTVIHLSLSVYNTNTWFTYLNSSVTSLSDSLRRVWDAQRHSLALSTLLSLNIVLVQCHRTVLKHGPCFRNVKIIAWSLHVCGNQHSKCGVICVS